MMLGMYMLVEPGVGMEKSMNPVEKDVVWYTKEGQLEQYTTSTRQGPMDSHPEIVKQRPKDYKCKKRRSNKMVD